MKANELRELSVAELEQKERELAEDIFQSRLKFQTGELNNTAKLKGDRRDLARVKTLLSHKRKAEAK
jgi:large subunit ribosomal protein L29